MLWKNTAGRWILKPRNAPKTGKLPFVVGNYLLECQTDSLVTGLVNISVEKTAT
jgi:hypothetical protein